MSGNSNDDRTSRSNLPYIRIKCLKTLQKISDRTGSFNIHQHILKQQITDLLKITQKKKLKQICIGVHGTDNNWIDFLLWLNSNYGKDGDDSLWFPSQEEYYEYNYYRLNSHISIAQIDASSFQINSKFNREKSSSTILLHYQFAGN